MYAEHVSECLILLSYICNLFLSFYFQDPKPEDGGAYKCTASNDNGESNANITLNFSGKFTSIRLN